MGEFDCKTNDITHISNYVDLIIFLSISTAITIGFVREMDLVNEMDRFIDICIEVKNNGMLEIEVSVAFSTAMATGSNAATSKLTFQ